jgi:hypothetical protein
MHSVTVNAFVDELTKISKRSITELLSSSASRAGLDPTKIPSIRQVGNVANNGNRSRAAEIAKNVRGYISAKKPSASAATAVAA